jgi:cytoskeletal protein RodZ
MKKFLIVGTVMLFLAVLISVAAFWYINNIFGNTPAKAEPNTTTTDFQESTTTIEIAPEVEIESPKLSDSQKEALDSVGVDSGSFTITPAMLDCAANKLSAERMAEIAAGDAPTAVEIAKLLPCLGA